MEKINIVICIKDQTNQNIPLSQRLIQSKALILFNANLDEFAEDIFLNGCENAWKSSSTCSFHYGLLLLSPFKKKKSSSFF